MPRSPRVFLEGGVYHVYNRVTRGEKVFGDDHEALFLLDTIREVRDRDGFIVLAWCIMGNHYHLAVRCATVPLWRSMASIHSKVSKSYNARYRVYGPFWQGRFYEPRDCQVASGFDPRPLSSSPFPQVRLAGDGCEYR